MALFGRHAVNVQRCLAKAPMMSALIARPSVLGASEHSLAARLSRLRSQMVANAATMPSRLASSSSSSTQPQEVPAYLNTKRDDYLLSFANASTAREAYHYTSYALAGGIPLALVIGSPVSTVVDLAFGLVIPLHAHIGMRSVLIDYVHDVPTQRIALLILAVFTGGMAVGLTMFNITDIGLTESIKQLWVKQPVPAEQFTPAIGGGKH